MVMIMTFSPLSYATAFYWRPATSAEAVVSTSSLPGYASRKHFAVHGSQHPVLPGRTRCQLQCRKLATTDR